MPRKVLVKSLLTDEEKAKAERLAAEQGLTISAYIRRVIVTAPEPKRQAA